MTFEPFQECIFACYFFWLLLWNILQKHFDFSPFFFVQNRRQRVNTQYGGEGVLREGGAGGGSPVDFDDGFKVSQGLFPQPEVGVDQATVQEGADVCRAVVDQHCNTNTTDQHSGVYTLAELR